MTHTIVNAYAYGAFAVSETLGKLGATSVIKKDYNPIWEQKIEFSCSTSKPLRFVVMDHDLLSKDDEMCFVEVPVQDCNGCVPS